MRQMGAVALNSRGVHRWNVRSILAGAALVFITVPCQEALAATPFECPVNRIVQSGMSSIPGGFGSQCVQDRVYAVNVCVPTGALPLNAGYDPRVEHNFMGDYTLTRRNAACYELRVRFRPADHRSVSFPPTFVCGSSRSMVFLWVDYCRPPGPHR